MDDLERKILTDRLTSVDAELDRLTIVAQYLRDVLGIEVSAPTAGVEATPPGRADDPVSLVNEGEFFATSAPKAARILLERVGRQHPLKTDDLFRAVTKGGVKIATASTLYRSLTRDDDFTRVGRGVWGLAAWYPNARKVKPNGEAEPTTAPTPDDAPPTAVPVGGGATGPEEAP